MNDVLSEAVDEAVGRSSKRWALILVAFVIGAVVAQRLSVRARARRAGSEAAPSAD